MACGTLWLLSSGKGQNRKFPIVHQFTYVGKDKDCDIRFETSKFDGKQFLLTTAAAGQVKIQNLSKRFPTLINGKEIAFQVDRVIKENDIITAGSHKMRWSYNVEKSSLTKSAQKNETLKRRASEPAPRRVAVVNPCRREPELEMDDDVVPKRRRTAFHHPTGPSTPHHCRNQMPLLRGSAEQSAKKVSFFQPDVPQHYQFNLQDFNNKSITPRTFYSKGLKSSTPYAFQGFNNVPESTPPSIFKDNSFLSSASALSPRWKSLRVSTPFPNRTRSGSFQKSRTSRNRQMSNTFFKTIMENDGSIDIDHQRTGSPNRHLVSDLDDLSRNPTPSSYFSPAPSGSPRMMRAESPHLPRKMLFNEGQSPLLANNSSQFGTSQKSLRRSSQFDSLFVNTSSSSQPRTSIPGDGYSTNLSWNSKGSHGSSWNSYNATPPQLRTPLRSFGFPDETQGSASFSPMSCASGMSLSTGKTYGRNSHASSFNFTGSPAKRQIFSKSINQSLSVQVLSRAVQKKLGNARSVSSSNTPHSSRRSPRYVKKLKTESPSIIKKESLAKIASADVTKSNESLPKRKSSKNASINLDTSVSIIRQSRNSATTDRSPIRSTPALRQSVKGKLQETEASEIKLVEAEHIQGDDKPSSETMIPMTTRASHKKSLRQTRSVSGDSSFVTVKKESIKRRKSDPIYQANRKISTRKFAARKSLSSIDGANLKSSPLVGSSKAFNSAQNQKNNSQLSPVIPAATSFPVSQESKENEPAAVHQSRRSSVKSTSKQGEPVRTRSTSSTVLAVTAGIVVSTPINSKTDNSFSTSLVTPLSSKKKSLARSSAGNRKIKQSVDSAASSDLSKNKGRGSRSESRRSTSIGSLSIMNISTSSGTVGRQIGASRSSQHDATLPSWSTSSPNNLPITTEATSQSPKGPTTPPNTAPPEVIFRSSRKSSVRKEMESSPDASPKTSRGNSKRSAEKASPSGKMRASRSPKLSSVVKKLKLDPEKPDKKKMAALKVCHGRRSPSKLLTSMFDKRWSLDNGTVSSQSPIRVEFLNSTLPHNFRYLSPTKWPHSSFDVKKESTPETDNGQPQQTSPEDELFSALDLSRTSSLVPKPPKPLRRLRSRLATPNEPIGPPTVSKSPKKLQFKIPLVEYEGSSSCEPKEGLSPTKSVLVTPINVASSSDSMVRVYTSSPSVSYTDCSGRKKTFKLSPTSPTKGGSIKELIAEEEISLLPADLAEPARISPSKRKHEVKQLEALGTSKKPKKGAISADIFDARSSRTVRRTRSTQDVPKKGKASNASKKKQSEKASRKTDNDPLKSNSNTRMGSRSQQKYIAGKNAKESSVDKKSSKAKRGDQSGEIIPKKNESPSSRLGGKNPKVHAAHTGVRKSIAPKVGKRAPKKIGAPSNVETPKNIVKFSPKITRRRIVEIAKESSPHSSSQPKAKGAPSKKIQSLGRKAAKASVSPVKDLSPMKRRRGGTKSPPPISSTKKNQRAKDVGKKSPSPKKLVTKTATGKSTSKKVSPKKAKTALSPKKISPKKLRQKGTKDAEETSARKLRRKVNAAEKTSPKNLRGKAKAAAPKGKPHSTPGKSPPLKKARGAAGTKRRSSVTAKTAARSSHSPKKRHVTKVETPVAKKQSPKKKGGSKAEKKKDPSKKQPKASDQADKKTQSAQKPKKGATNKKKSEAKGQKVSKPKRKSSDVSKKSPIKLRAGKLVKAVRQKK